MPRRFVRDHLQTLCAFPGNATVFDYHLDCTKVRDSPTRLTQLASTHFPLRSKPATPPPAAPIPRPRTPPAPIRAPALAPLCPHPRRPLLPSPQRFPPDFRPWAEAVPAFSYNREVPYFQMMVPTVDTVRFSYLLEACLDVQRSVLFTGEEGEAGRRCAPVRSPRVRKLRHKGSGVCSGTYGGCEVAGAGRQ